MPQSVLHLKWTTSIEIADVDLQAAIVVLWMDVRFPAIARLFLESAPDEIQPTLIEVIAKLVRPGHPDHDRRSIGNDAKALLAFPQRLLSVVLCSNVARHFRGSNYTPR